MGTPLFQGDSNQGIKHTFVARALVTWKPATGGHAGKSYLGGVPTSCTCSHASQGLQQKAKGAPSAPAQMPRPVWWEWPGTGGQLTAGVNAPQPSAFRMLVRPWALVLYSPSPLSCSWFFTRSRDCTKIVAPIRQAPKQEPDRLREVWGFHLSSPLGLAVAAITT